MTDTTLPRWDVSDVHESFTARSFTDALEQVEADLSRLEAAFDALRVLSSDVYATVSTESRDPAAQARCSELMVLEARTRPLLSRLAGWLDRSGSTRSDR